MLKRGFETVEANLFVGLAEICQVLLTVDFEELDEFFFFEGGDY